MIEIYVGVLNIVLGTVLGASALLLLILTQVVESKRIHTFLVLDPEADDIEIVTPQEFDRITSALKTKPIGYKEIYYDNFKSGRVRKLGTMSGLEVVENDGHGKK